jgi:hypothetical protein
MKLLESKIAIEQYIFDNYTATQIHWAGTKFDTSAYDEWVHFVYVAEMVSDCGFDNAKFSQDGALQVTVIAKTNFRVNQIADLFLDLFKGKKISNLFAKKVKILSQDYLVDLDKSVMSFDIEFTTY